MERKFLEQIRIGEQSLPEEVINAIWSECEKDAQGFAQQLAQVRFDSALNEVITRSGGRSVKAVKAMLDMDALQQSGDPKAAVKAVEQLKQSAAWLFSDPKAPPYAPATGTQQLPVQEPQTLAGALRERMSRRDG